MKGKKNILISILVITLILSGVLVPNKTYASNLNAYLTTKYKELPAVTVDKNKVFTITFNREVTYKTINRNTIKVINSTNNEVNVGVGLIFPNKKKVMVRAPKEGYTEGETYTLIVKDGILDINDLKLAEEVVMKFTIKSETPQPTKDEDKNKSENEIFIYNLYKTNSPYWNQGIKFIDGKLNFQKYDYETKTNSWQIIPTYLNHNINNQILDVFKTLYTQKEGYKTNVLYTTVNNDTGLCMIDFYGKDLTAKGVPFTEFILFDSNTSTDNKRILSVSIPQCTKGSYNNNSYRIKSALGAALNSSSSDEIFNYINNQYTNTVLAENYDSISITKTFGSLKVIVNSHDKGLFAEIIKLEE